MTEVRECVPAWLKNQELSAYEGGKKVREYYQCRNILKKYDWSAVKLIKAMLARASVKVPMRELYRKAIEYEQYLKAVENTKNYAGAREYVIDVKRFMNEGEDDVANEIYLP